VGALIFVLPILIAFVVIVGTLLLVFIGTAIPLVILGIRRRRGFRSRSSTIAMTVLGILFGVATLLLAVIALLIFVPAATSS
jgi:hypothetical protein